MKYLLRGSVLLAAIAAGSAAFAQVTFTTFGAGDTYQTNTGYTLGGPSQDRAATMQFTTSIGGILDHIRFASFYVEGQTTLNMTLSNDNANEIGSGIVVAGIPKSNNTAEITTWINPFPSIVLAPSTAYWLSMTATGDAWQAWNLNDQSIQGRLGFSSDDGGTWTYNDDRILSAVEVNVRPVPEPATMIALGAGLAALAARRRRKRA